MRYIISMHCWLSLLCTRGYGALFIMYKRIWCTYPWFLQSGWNCNWSSCCIPVWVIEFMKLAAGINYSSLHLQSKLRLPTMWLLVIQVFLMVHSTLCQVAGGPIYTMHAPNAEDTCTSQILCQTFSRTAHKICPSINPILIRWDPLIRALDIISPFVISKCSYMLFCIHKGNLMHNLKLLFGT